MASFLDLTVDSFPLTSYGCTEKTYLEAEEARPQHPQESSADRDAEMSALPGDEAPTSRVRGVRLLRREAAGSSQGSLTWRGSRWTPWAGISRPKRRCPARSSPLVSSIHRTRSSSSGKPRR